MRTSFVLYCLFHAALARKPEINVMGFEGGEVFFQCAHKFANQNSKYFCKDSCENREDILATVVSGGQTKSGRITLVDSGNGAFMVKIRHLQLSDSGVYWCAVDRPGLDTYTSVNLTVQKAGATTTTATAAPVVSSTWTQNTTNSTQPIDVMETKTPTNILTGPILYTVIGAIGTVAIVILTTVFKKRRKVSKPQAHVSSNNMRKELDCEINGIQWEKIMFSGKVNTHHQGKDPQTSTGTDRSAPCPVYENLSFTKDNDSSRFQKVPPIDQQNQDVPSRIYITLLPSEASARTADGSALKHTVEPVRSESSATCAASAPECVSTQKTSLWFGLDLSKTNQS